MSINYSKRKEIHKSCKTEMKTIALKDRIENLTYCPKCVSDEDIIQILKDNNGQNYV